MLIQGKCHCGNISFSLTWEPAPVEILARACTCSFCTKHGGAWTSNPTSSLEVEVKDPSLDLGTHLVLEPQSSIPAPGAA